MSRIPNFFHPVKSFTCFLHSLGEKFHISPSPPQTNVKSSTNIKQGKGRNRGGGEGVKDKPVALCGCSADLVPKCLEMPVTFLPSLDWMDGVRLACSNNEPQSATPIRPQRCIIRLTLVSTSFESQWKEFT